MNRIEEFIRIYNELDKAMKKSLDADRNLSHMKVLDMLARRSDIINRNLEVLKQYARLRNCIVHDTVSGVQGAIAVPLPEVVDRYRGILNRFNNPLTVYDLCTPISKLLVASRESLAIDIMKAMEKGLISRVPILENDKVIGVFTGNVLIYYLSRTKQCLISNKTVIRELIDFASFDFKGKEEFDFVSKTLNVYDAEKYFKKTNKDNHRLVALFITSDGTRNGRLLGLLTEWDLFNKIDLV